MKATLIHMAVLRDLETDEVIVCRSSEELKKHIELNAKLIGHNLICFDVPVLKKLWKIQIPLSSVQDTLVLSRLYKPDLENGHSLEEWGKRLGEKKSDFTDFDCPAENEGVQAWQARMERYCVQDTGVTAKLYRWLQREFKSLRFNGECFDIEHKVAYEIWKQQQNGFKLDIPYATKLRDTLQVEHDATRDSLVSLVPPKLVVMKTKVKTLPFNPGSREQCRAWLLSKGWVPEVWTMPGDSKRKLTTEEKDELPKELRDKSKPSLDDDVLAEIDQIVPEAAPLARYYMIQKRIAQINSWLLAVKEDGRVHGTVMSNGAVTGRMTHSGPNMAQVPKVAKKVPYGKECRTCWTVEEGNVLVGIDASGLEARTQAHYVYPYDPDYAATLYSGDIHSLNLSILRDYLSERDDVKTWYYAWLYGAGAAKLGKICGGDKRTGMKTVELFLEKTAPVKKLKDSLKPFVAKKTLPGIDGRRIWIRSEHAALNSLLQSCGAIIMKKALVLFSDMLYNNGYDVKFVANVHDEWQIECKPEIAEYVGQLGVQAIADAGTALGIRVPLTGEYKIGRNWAETH